MMIMIKIMMMQIPLQSSPPSRAISPAPRCYNDQPQHGPGPRSPSLAAKVIVVDNEDEFTNDRRLIDNTDKATHIKVSEDDSPFMRLLPSTGKAVCFTFALKYIVQVISEY